MYVCMYFLCQNNKSNTRKIKKKKIFATNAKNRQKGIVKLQWAFFALYCAWLASCLTFSSAFSLILYVRIFNGCFCFYVVFSFTAYLLLNNLNCNIYFLRYHTKISALSSTLYCTLWVYSCAFISIFVTFFCYKNPQIHFQRFAGLHICWLTLMAATHAIL